MKTILVILVLAITSVSKAYVGPIKTRVAKAYAQNAIQELQRSDVTCIEITDSALQKPIILRKADIVRGLRNVSAGFANHYIDGSSGKAKDEISLYAYSNGSKQRLTFEIDPELSGLQQAEVEDKYAINDGSVEAPKFSYYYAGPTLNCTEM